MELERISGSIEWQRNTIMNRDFDPLIAEVFLECREKVEQIHNGIRTKQKEEII